MGIERWVAARGYQRERPTLGALIVACALIALVFGVLAIKAAVGG